MKVLIVGNGGRESAFAWKLSEDNNKIFAVIQHKNPSIIEYVNCSGGEFIIGNILDGKLIADYATEKNIELAFINSDSPLEAGVVDALLKAGVKTVGPDRLSSEIEWNKSFAMKLFQEVIPDYTPRYWIAESQDMIETIFSQVIKDNISIVVKPQGLTGGKGVKVMGEHLANFEEAKQYAIEVLSNKIGNSETVIIGEKLEGKEFTMQVITDGNIIIPPPITYDHPYRYDFDKGPGTGGMGSFTDIQYELPFMKKNDYDTCINIIQKIINGIEKTGRQFNGVLNPGFFLTKKGIRIMEVNARCGDPESMNIMLLIDVSLSTLLSKIFTKTLTQKDVRFKREASVVKYLVTPEYANGKGKQYKFFLDKEKIINSGVQVFFSAAEETEKKHIYQTVGNSRVVALATTDKNISAATQKIENAIANFVRGQLEHRRDIGTSEELNLLSHI